jgi:uncharacterized protein (DUF433 family)
MAFAVTAAFLVPLWQILPPLGYNKSMSSSTTYSPAEASAVTDLPIRTVRKLIDRRLVRPRRLRTGRTVERRLSREQVLYLRLEAKGVQLLPMSARREIARRIEADPQADVVFLAEGGAVLIEVKTAREELEQELERLERAQSLIGRDPEIMGGTPIYRGTRIPVELVADMLEQGASVEDILEGYPSLDKERIALAQLYVRAFPRRGRPAARPWAKRKPIHTSFHRTGPAGRT